MYDAPFSLPINVRGQELIGIFRKRADRFEEAAKPERLAEGQADGFVDYDPAVADIEDAAAFAGPIQRKMRQSPVVQAAMLERVEQLKKVKAERAEAFAVALRDSARAVRFIADHIEPDRVYEVPANYVVTLMSDIGHARQCRQVLAGFDPGVG
jgi:hypothetical protein